VKQFTTRTPLATNCLVDKRAALAAAAKPQVMPSWALLFVLVNLAMHAPTSDVFVAGGKLSYPIAKSMQMVQRAQQPYLVRVPDKSATADSSREYLFVIGGCSCSLRGCAGLSSPTSHSAHPLFLLILIPKYCFDL
jgi:hypothetical protein